MDKDHAKTIPISLILDKLNVKPTRIGNSKALYLSPIRNEKTPSFWVYFKSNRFYDYGLPGGGDSIEFARLYLKYHKENNTMADALRWLKNMSGENFFIPTDAPKAADIEEDEPVLILKSQKPIQYVGLVHYLEKRGISLTTAQKHIKEIFVFNKNSGKSFRALGFKNENDGYELRNPFFKGSIRPKTITFIRGRKSKPDGIHIFEGFMDYVSVITQLNGKSLDDDAIVLNSISCLNLAIPYIQNYGYKTAYTWMDNDPAGHRATEILNTFFKTQDNLRHVKMNSVYAPHKDVNAWHMHKLGLPPLPA